MRIRTARSYDEAMAPHSTGRIEAKPTPTKREGRARPSQSGSEAKKSPRAPRRAPQRRKTDPGLRALVEFLKTPAHHFSGLPD